MKKHISNKFSLERQKAKVISMEEFKKEHNPTSEIEQIKKNMPRDVNLELNMQDIINIVEALDLYKRLVLPKRFRPLVSFELDKITNQLKKQDVNLYKNQSEDIQIGDKVNYNNEQIGFCIGTSDDDGMIKLVISIDNEVSIIEVPIILCKRVDDLCKV